MLMIILKNIFYLIIYKNNIFYLKKLFLTLTFQNNSKNNFK